MTFTFVNIVPWPSQCKRSVIFVDIRVDHVISSSRVSRLRRLNTVITGYLDRICGISLTVNIS